MPVRESNVSNAAFKITRLGATLNLLCNAQHVGTNLKYKVPIWGGKIEACFKGEHGILNVTKPKPQVWWFCTTNVACYMGAKVPNYVKKKPLIPDVRPVMRGMNLTQEEVDAMTSAGFKIVARLNFIDEESLSPLEGPVAR